ncbi:unnamed protein product [Hermetia illucens]|uniref:ABC transporter domain-containing protein n=1 Tax=Hermetia illucens TaxID=343691 RepID=A0A7R8UEM4_HERIL|nr:ATP-binding cassette sub-family G member 1 [Hermetia illucens]XP_037926667.1 ATP-binding cassette sub-family G member 1 [Hermetia illucens]XP_037926668.1 ATP-binding cassette sub-family G member 1 [Hermetia illucens]XP_037926669.1 ATP-binding cassette sub-family G member 1 [Hermetia illucens]XP_037926670.1 ATP-binding cassette sub-family G member 1 [Hermetia illucens]CAD7079385.1 unnamed protein product [Hermetia illucens]
MSDSATDLLLTNQQITLECRNVTYRPKSKSLKEDILKDVCGKFIPGRLTAILGPSGAGKTTFLNVLSGFKDTGVGGSILTNGTSRRLTEFRKISSYIPQQFAMLDKLTVVETLEASADFKLGLRTKKSFKEKIISEIINLLNLEKCTHTLVEGLSGGEKKRLSIGIELVTNPPIMFFDEPTSGLDSVSSLQVITYLQSLAHSGRTIVCVVHQPSSRLLNLFDDLLVLSAGEVIYNGSQHDMVKCFQNDGFSCPNYYNPADYAIEVASREHGSDLSSLIASNKSKFCDDSNIQLDVKVEENSIVLNGFTKTEKCKNYKDKGGYAKAYPATFAEQFAIITRRSMRSMVRDMLTVQMRVIAHVFIAVLLGVVFYNVGNDAAKVLSNVSCLFFMLMFIYFANSMPIVLTCPLETQVFLREHLNNWYSLRAYFLAKCAADIPLQFLCPTLFVAIAYYLTGQPNEVSRFLMFWAICLLMGAVGQGVGLFCGCSFGMNLSVFLVPVSSIPMMIFCGFFIRFNELPECLQPLTYVSYFRYAFEGSIQAIFGYNRPDLECNIAFCYYKTTTKFLQELDMTGDLFEWDVIVLASWIVVLQIALFISLIVKVKLSQ